MRKLLPIFLLFTCSISFLSAQVENYSAGLNGQKLDWLIYYIEDYYVEKVDSDSLTELAITRVVQELDPYSSYQTKEEVEAQVNADKGYSGKAAGFNYYYLRDTAIVTYVNSKGPAETAGMRRGDQLLTLNGKSLIGNGSQALSTAMNEKEIETLELKLLRGGKEKIDIKLTKALVPWLSVNSAYMLTNSIGYIKLGKFTLKTMEEFVPSLDYLRSLGMQELILDLRGNNGGVVSQALELADQFLPAGKVVYTEQGANRETKEFLSTAAGGWLRGKVVIMQDAVTASASEIFIGAMQDWDRAVIVGVSTYGKGLIQQSYKLGDGSNIRLTVGKYCTPTGRILQRKVGTSNNDCMTPYQQPLLANSLTSKLSIPSDLQGKSSTGRSIITGPGGIVPDVYYNWVDNQDWTLFNDLNNKGYLYEYITDYVLKNRQILKSEYNTVRSFHEDRIREAFMLKDFRSFLESRNLGYELPRNFPDNIIFQLKSWLASQLWHDNAFHEMDNMDDKVLERAREIHEGRVHDMLGITY